MHQVILCLQMKYINTKVLHHQILILTDDSLTLDSLYQKTSGQITSITARDMKYLARKGEMSQVLSQTLTCGFAWCRWIKTRDHLTFILKRSLMRQVLRDRCSSDFCMYVPLLTVQFNYMYFNFSFQKSDEESLTPVTVWVVCDVETPKGRELLYSAIRQLVSSADTVYFNLHK